MSSNDIKTNNVNASRLAEQGPSCGRCSRQGNISSNVNEVIRTISNLYLFLRKDFASAKSTKTYKDATKQKHKKHKKANKRINDILPLKRIKTLPFFFLFAYMRFVLVVRVKSFCKKKIKKSKTALMASFTLLVSQKLFLLSLKNLPAILLTLNSQKLPLGETP